MKAGELRARRGACPAALTLIEYRRGVLAEAERNAVREHIRGCGLCDTAFVQLKRTQGSGITRAVAATLVAVSAGALLVYMNLNKGPGAGGALQSAVLLDLNPVRSASPKPQSARMDDRLVLSFYVPMVSGGGYSATLRNSSGTVVLRQKSVISHDATGNCVLVWSRPQGESGEYLLTVEDDQGTPYRFHFQVK